MNKLFCSTWNTGINTTRKTPTTVLIKPNGKDCMSFGYDAEREFVDLEPAEQKKHYLFRQFKMKVFSNPGLSLSTKLKDITDKELPAVDVFAAVIKFFRERLHKKLNRNDLDDISYDDVYWVIPVPAIWVLRAKQFTRKAAEKAGLKDYQLSLVLEPEAASLYCRKIPMEINTKKDGAKQITSLPEGTEYLVVDLEGDFIDIAVHIGLHQATGWYYGGMCENDEFMSFLKRLFGGPVLMTIKEEHPGDYVDLMNDFKQKKLTFMNLEMDWYNITLRLPVSWFDAYQEETECQIEECLKDTVFADDVHIKRDKMMISKKLFETFCQSSVNNLVRIIKEVLDKPSMSKVTTFFAVGGYAEPALIKETLQTTFPDKMIVIPTDPSLSVIKGSVIYGFESMNFASRVCKDSNGITQQNIWKEGDIESRTRWGLNQCDGMFDKHVEVDQVVNSEEFQQAEEYFAVEDQQMSSLDLYTPTQKNPRFVDDLGCICVGYLVLDLSGGNTKEKILSRVCVGGTELEMEVMNSSGHVFKSYCNF